MNGEPRFVRVCQAVVSADTAGFLAKRLRATSAAAAAPKRSIIGGAGTGLGPPGVSGLPG